MFVDAPAPSELPPSPERFLEALGGPAAIRVPGRDRSRTRAVATLLHGNEPSGLRAIHAWLRQGVPPATDALFLIPSVEAALGSPGFQHRARPGRPDLNRCFRGSNGAGPEERLAGELLAILREAKPDALVDLHNTTGHTPPYAVAPGCTPRQLGLASLFASRYIESDLALGTLVEATAGSCPSVVIECGHARAPGADHVARAGLESYLGRARLLASDAARPVEVLRRPVRVGLLPGLTLAYDERARDDADVTVLEWIDRHNFECLPAGTPIGWVRRPEPWPLHALGADGRDVSRDLFALRGDRGLETRVDLVPVMITTEPEIALSDCLFYAVRPEALPDPGPQAGAPS